jgi:hypothetical protein
MSVPHSGRAKLLENSLCTPLAVRKIGIPGYEILRMTIGPGQWGKEKKDANDLVDSGEQNQPTPCPFVGTLNQTKREKKM